MRFTAYFIGYHRKNQNFAVHTYLRKCTFYKIPPVLNKGGIYEIRIDLVPHSDADKKNQQTEYRRRKHRASRNRTKPLQCTVYRHSDKHSNTRYCQNVIEQRIGYIMLYAYDRLHGGRRQGNSQNKPHSCPKDLISSESTGYRAVPLEPQRYKNKRDIKQCRNNLCKKYRREAIRSV